MSQPPLRRRELIQGGALSLIGGAIGAARSAGSEAPGGSRTSAKSAIFLLLVGGPSQLDTWDPKPEAASGIRSPFRPIRTNVPGIEVSELFPRMARHADKYALIRSCYHHASPVHDLGHQLVQTGRLSAKRVDYPHIGFALEKLEGSRDGLPGHIVLGGAIGATGGNLSHGQSAGFLRFDPGRVNDPAIRRALNLRETTDGEREGYGDTSFGRDCLRARRLVEAGVRFVTVNMFATVFGLATWDTHGWAPFTSMAGLRDEVAPAFDRAYSALLTDLLEKNLLPETLVVATGEFGRTPKLNPAGGRDHWTQCWTALMAGGGVRGGQVIGASDACGGEPAHRPVHATELLATVYHAFGMRGRLALDDQSGNPVPLVSPGTDPIQELFS